MRVFANESLPLALKKPGDRPLTSLYVLYDMGVGSTIAVEKVAFVHFLTVLLARAWIGEPRFEFISRMNRKPTDFSSDLKVPKLIVSLRFGFAIELEITSRRLYVAIFAPFFRSNHLSILF